MQTAIPLFENEFFPWGGLPYPCEHAKLGVDLLHKGDREAAEKMAAFQQATLDHRNKPIYSLFQQEEGCRFAELEEASRAFFEELGAGLEMPYQYVDPELGCVFHRAEEQTVLCLASGCKSGMGVFLVGGGGVLNFGPQLRPLGECAGFGLAGRGRNIRITANSLSYQCRLAAPHGRDTGIPWLKDSGYSAAWVESACAVERDRLSVSCEIEGCRPLSDFLFTCFIKADACYVAGSHKLNPRSLDRYQGPPQLLKIEGINIIPEGGFSAMEVVPLAGDESFWGADFMLSLTLLNKTFQFTINKA